MVKGILKHEIPPKEHEVSEYISTLFYKKPYLTKIQLD